MELLSGQGEPGKCLPLLKGDLIAKYYYVYAVDYDKGGSWGGKAMMCTRDKVFTIRGIEDCAGRGYQKTGFFEVDTGEETLTGGRLRRVADYLKHDEAFCFTYGDGVSDVDISREIAFHKQHGKLATVTAVQPPGRYGALQMDGAQVTGFSEKPRGDGGLINGGFFVLSPRCLDLINHDQTSWESEPLARLSQMNELMAFEHDGFWQPMDTLREKNLLEELWASGRAPWKTWA